MIRYIAISIFSGLLFGVLDGLIYANPIARKLFSFYKPISRQKIHISAGIIIYVMYGFVMSALFLKLYTALPGNAGITKAVSYSIIIWFFRVVMSSVSQWMMFTISVKAILYVLITGLLEMLILGFMYGVFLT
jgi:hypothetical protein